MDLIRLDKGGAASLSIKLLHKWLPRIMKITIKRPKSTTHVKTICCMCITLSRDTFIGRQAVGIDVILGAVARVMKDKPLKEASIVDIGTNYCILSLLKWSYCMQVC